MTLYEVLRAYDVLGLSKENLEGAVKKGHFPLPKEPRYIVLAFVVANESKVTLLTTSPLLIPFYKAEVKTIRVKNGCLEVSIDSSYWKKMIEDVVNRIDYSFPNNPELREDYDDESVDSNL